MPLIKELFFPTPIYFVDFEYAGAWNAFLKTRIYSWYNREPHGIVRSNVKQVGSWHSPTTMHHMAEFQLFCDAVTRQFNAIFADQLYSESFNAKCLNMWANVNPHSGYNRSHVHPGSLWSGVYYVQTPSDCGQIIFQDPRPQSQVLLAETQPAHRAEPEQWKEIYHQAVAGRLVVFPSWLQHGVEPNMSSLPSPEGDRISVAFNFGQQQCS